MTIEIGIVLFVVVVMIVCLIKEVTRPDFIVFCALAVLLLLGVLSPADALKGFSNEGMITVALLFIVAGAVQQSGLLTQVVLRTLGKGKKTKSALLRMMIPVSGLSAFLNNTPIVVMFTPVVRKWCQDHNIAPSKFLIPLSYATIFGGTITLIGTSTNLLAHGLMIESGMSGYSMFTLAIVGIPAALAGTLYMSTIGYRLLPNRKTSEESFHENTKEYLSELVVETDAPMIGKTIEQAGLRNLSGLYLIEIIRKEGDRIAPITSQHKIREGDRLLFTGLISTIVELQNIKGLRVQTSSQIRLDDLQNGTQSLFEVVVSHQSSLTNRSIKEAKFRERFGGGVIAVHRNDERINSKVGDIVLQPGDTLLVLASKDFVSRWSNSKAFYLMNSVKEQAVIDPKKSMIAIVTLIVMVLLATFELLTMLKAATLAVLVLFLTKTVSFESVKKYVHFNVLLLIASAIGIGVALEQTGAAALLAEHLILITKGLGIIGVIAVVYLITTIFTEIITNNAAVVLMFPIAFATASQMAIDPLSLLIPITIAASASFATPIGYQTNLIVYGPGGYRFNDYLKVGIPLNILYMVVTVLISYFVWL
ncbi:SLC13 family permease [Alkalihalobacillus sp. LMS39]|uniref:SLC13 family permease n=1 Tax=Alkalihalobacillus sp. LMS39 TaxID=2924032 RepID=UPI001FB42C54|nr:SLC13 family permease [Alkalihalobacillus sp. LMS39]UOE92520.1 SLC13 family permease [Alkalihalobacillus sp. LMS39]